MENTKLVNNKKKCRWAQRTMLEDYWYLSDGYAVENTAEECASNTPELHTLKESTKWKKNLW